MGMTDRGADVGFLSQFPHEEEILFAPLTGMEVESTSIEGDVLLVKAKLTVNMASLTLEQVFNLTAICISAQGPINSCDLPSRPI